MPSSTASSPTRSGRDQPIAVIEPRGMHRPGPPDRTLDGLATHVFEEIEARLGPDDPCLILGFSGGGPVAYEAAQRMHAKGRHVHLVLLDSAPSTKGRQRSARAGSGRGTRSGCPAHHSNRLGQGASRRGAAVRATPAARAPVRAIGPRSRTTELRARPIPRLQAHPGCRISRLRSGAGRDSRRRSFRSMAATRCAGAAS